MLPIDASHLEPLSAWHSINREGEAEAEVGEASTSIKNQVQDIVGKKDDIVSRKAFDGHSWGEYYYSILLLLSNYQNS